MAVFDGLRAVLQKISAMVMASGISMCVRIQQVKQFPHWKVIGCLEIFIDSTKFLTSGFQNDPTHLKMLNFFEFDRTYGEIFGMKIGKSKGI